jgi:hypothetical protein
MKAKPANVPAMSGVSRIPNFHREEREARGGFCNNHQTCAAIERDFDSMMRQSLRSLRTFLTFQRFTL